MPEDKVDQNMIAVKLDSERRREIDEIKERFEERWREEVRFQADMKHAMEIVGNKQDSMKERFESGTANTLRELRKDFSSFLTEWGKKQEQDKTRDQFAKSINDKADSTQSNLNWLMRSLIVSIAGGVSLGIIIYVLQFFKG